MRYDNLTNTTSSDRHAAFSEAFSDYLLPMRPTEAELQQMLLRRGFDAQSSIGAFDGSALVGFTFNCLGEWRGEPAGYDSGTGVVPRARRRGIAEEMMRRSCEALRARGAQSYVLEVLEANRGAAELYRRCGFEVSRMLQCFSYDGVAELSDAVTGETRLPDAAVRWFDAAPSWQNAPASVERAGGAPMTLVVRDGDRDVGLLFLFPASGDVPMFAVDPAWRRRGIGRTLIRAARARSEKPLRLVNIDEGATGVLAFLDAVGATRTVRQYEMAKSLS